jgi:ABC-type arginine transport system ATPase subunit
MIDTCNELDMWGYMLAADLVINKMEEKGIIILGASKIGKSTLFYHMLNVPMIGKKVKRDINFEFTLDTISDHRITHSKSS